MLFIMRRPKKKIGETFQNQTPDSPFAEFVSRRNHNSSDSNTSL